jgi:hypothetical protein
MSVLKHACFVAIAAMAVFLPRAMARADDPFEIVHFQSLTFPGELFQPFLPPAEQGRPAAIFGMLRLPPGAERAPAVVVLHGCWGVTARASRRSW